MAIKLISFSKGNSSLLNVMNVIEFLYSKVFFLCLKCAYGKLANKTRFRFMQKKKCAVEIKKTSIQSMTTMHFKFQTSSTSPRWNNSLHKIVELSLSFSFYESHCLRWTILLYFCVFVFFFLLFSSFNMQSPNQCISFAIFNSHNLCINKYCALLLCYGCIHAVILHFFFFSILWMCKICRYLF